MNFNKIFIINILLILTLFSCERYLGYGVIMLPDEERELDTGDLIEITKESRIRDTWVYNTPTEEHIEINKSHVEFYENREDALKYIEENSEFKDYYVIVNKNGLPMRIKPSTDTNSVYRLPKDKRVKVIGRTAEKDKVSKKLEGYWWHLITSEGIKGWTFDYYLNVYNKGELIFSNEEEDTTELHEFFRNVWRPTYFWEMQKSRNIDLNKFQSKFKLTPDLENKEITIFMPDHYFNSKFTEFKKTGANNYTLVGSTVQLDFSYNGKVIVIYSEDSKSYVNEFIYIKDSVINEIINTTKTTRKIKYNEFILNGPSFYSKAYGNITFLEDNKFRWTEKENLRTKQLLTSNANSEGNISFKYFLGQDLKGIYDGVITFDFGNRQELTFLYTFNSSGIRFLYVPITKINKNIIETDEFYTPIDLFFTGQQ